jgi:hypothetical protein
MQGSRGFRHHSTEGRCGSNRVPRRAVDDRIPADADDFGAMPSRGIDLVQNMSKPGPFVKTGVTAMVDWVGDAFK